MLFLVVLSAVGKKPQIIVPPLSRLSAVIRLEMHLHCLATGTPPPVVRWYYIGPVWSEHVKNSIHNGSAYRVHNNGTLVIGGITEKNVGFYECAASNVIGTATKKAGIYIPGKFVNFALQGLKGNFATPERFGHHQQEDRDRLLETCFSLTNG